ncbi:MAG: 4Fe-4S binding protein [Deltaproteobacteria bacterium]|nr:4Fe-4S binding protein [Deltaproteobacteria bacterium]
MKIKRKIIKIDETKCDGCGVCVPSCAEGAIQIIDGKARLIAEKFCDGLGACLGECPNDALQVIEREAEDFDEKAVEEHLKSKGEAHHEEPATMACGCPSAQIQSFAPAETCQEANQPVSHPSAQSALAHWPVQVRLVPPTAPFLKGADLLIAADCTPIAYPNFHRDFLKGKAVMVGCPKFDDAQTYIQKFADIFNTAGIKSIEVVTMEVPCCQGLPMLVKKGLELSGKKIPLSQVIISIRGEVLKTQKLVA